MRSFSHALAAVALVGASLALCAPTANAGRAGGPASEVVTIPAYQSYYVDVPFLANGPAMISSAGNGLTTVELYLYDGDGNVVTGAGIGDRRTLVTPVTQAGFFRVELRNLGPAANTVVIGTN
jgi:hypothetical protein